VVGDADDNSEGGAMGGSAGDGAATATVTGTGGDVEVDAVASCRRRSSICSEVCIAQ
jgi:hypothetical protein